MDHKEMKSNTEEQQLEKAVARCFARVLSDAAKSLEAAAKITAAPLNPEPLKQAEDRRASTAAPSMFGYLVIQKDYDADTVAALECLKERAAVSSFDYGRTAYEIEEGHIVQENDGVTFQLDLVKLVGRLDVQNITLSELYAAAERFGDSVGVQITEGGVLMQDLVLMKLPNLPLNNSGLTN